MKEQPADHRDFLPSFVSQSVFRRFRVERFRLSICYRAGVEQDRGGSSGCFLWLCNPPLLAATTTQTTTTMLICLLLNRNCFFDVILWARALFSTPSRERRKVSPFHPPVFRFVVYYRGLMRCRGGFRMRYESELSDYDFPNSEISILKFSTIVLNFQIWVQPCKNIVQTPENLQRDIK